MVPLLHDPPELLHIPRWLMWLPIIGWSIGYQRQIENERRLVNQAVERGRVPESAWMEYDCNQMIRRKIEEIVIAHAYPEGSTFHPLDPIELMAVIRYGDLNEVEIITEIEDEFGVEITEESTQEWIDRKTTFVDFIRWIEDHGSSTRC